MLYAFLFIGLALTMILVWVRNRHAKHALAEAGLVLVNIGALAVLLPAYFITRLYDAAPPSPQIFLIPYVPPLTLIILVDMLLLLLLSNNRGASGSPKRR